MAEAAWVPQEIRDVPWYHGAIKRHESEELLTSEPCGTYLIRLSSKPNQFVFTIKCDEGVKHTVIDYTENKYKYGTREYSTFKEFSDFVSQAKTLRFANFSVKCVTPLLMYPPAPHPPAKASAGLPHQPPRSKYDKPAPLPSGRSRAASNPLRPDLPSSSPLSPAFPDNANKQSHTSPGFSPTAPIPAPKQNFHKYNNPPPPPTSLTSPEVLSSSAPPTDAPLSSSAPKITNFFHKLKKSKPTSASTSTDPPGGSSDPQCPSCHAGYCHDPAQHAKVIGELGSLMHEGLEEGGGGRESGDRSEGNAPRSEEYTYADGSPSNKEDADALKAVVEGYLTKRGGSVKNWKYRWVVVSGTTLQYYKKKGETEALNTLALQECAECVQDDSTDKDFCFRLVQLSRTFFFYANSEEEMRKFVDVINRKMTILKRILPQAEH